jgi:hypothetical protein
MPSGTQHHNRKSTNAPPKIEEPALVALVEALETMPAEPTQELAADAASPTFSFWASTSTNTPVIGSNPTWKSKAPANTKPFSKLLPNTRTGHQRSPPHLYQDPPSDLYLDADLGLESNNSEAAANPSGPDIPASPKSPTAPANPVIVGHQLTKPEPTPPDQGLERL